MYWFGDADEGWKFRHGYKCDRYYMGMKLCAARILVVIGRIRVV